MKQNYLLLCLFSFSVCFIAATVAREVIIGGDQARTDEFPYHVALLYGRITECGGGIIGAQFILTAAHCVINDDDGQLVNHQLTVLAGTKDLHKIQPPAMFAQVTKVYVPREYDYRLANPTGDIAVLKLKQPLRLSRHIKKLELAKEKDVYAGTTARISGFGWSWIHHGKNKSSGGYLDSHLRFAVVDVLKPCHPNYSGSSHSDKHICARVKQDHRFKFRGVCNGDSGGLLVHGGTTAIGVLSTSPKMCSETSKGAQYTRIGNYLKFIDNAIHDRQHDDIIEHSIPS